MSNVQPSTVLWLIRHAEVEPRYQSIFGGRIDMELSERGHEQAALLADYLRGRQFGAVYASPMRRVQQTLAPLLACCEPKLTILPELREVDFGDWTGLSWDEVKAKYGVSAFAWLEQLEEDAIANAECAKDLRARVEPCIRHILAAHTCEDIAVICHGGVIRMLLAILLKWRFSALAPFEINYASISQLRLTPTRAKLELLNFTPWRELVAEQASR